MQFNHLYDHVLSELEFGRTENGINLLVGMLDAAEMAGSENGAAHSALQAHPLHAMLMEDPLCADAQRRPDNSIHRVNMLNSRSFDVQVSSTGHRLFAATSKIAFARALCSRREHAERKLNSAWRIGQKIWLITDPQQGLLSSLHGAETSNIIVSTEYEFERAIKEGNITDAQFDLILAPHLPDRFSASAMRKIIILLKGQLSQSGQLAMSALQPSHPGTGWRRACFGWEPMCHDGEALAGMAAPGFVGNTYRDETGCIAWVEMRRG
jgi:hypothetical protein